MKILKTLWGAWKKFADITSSISNTILLGLIYITIVTPIFAYRKLTVKKEKQKTFWKDFEQEDGMEAARRQF